MTTKYDQYSLERKAQQQAGTLPDFYSTAGFQLINEKEYVSNGETVKDRYTTIAKTLSNHLPYIHREKYNKIFFDLLWDGLLSASTPVFINTGSVDKGLPISCSGSFILDSVDSFYKVSHEIAMLSKLGFGTSVYLGDIRPRGSSIRSGGKSDGVVPVMELIFSVANHISQGNNRRGSVATYLPMSHPDFWEVCHFLENNSDGSNMGWVISDDDLSKLDDQDTETLARYQEIMYLRMLGMGYLVNVDKANRLAPDVYKANNISIYASNLCCVTGNQRVVTENGIKLVKDLYDSQSDNVVMGIDGKSSATKMQLISESEEIYRIHTSEGYSHDVTKNHRVWVKDIGWVEAQDLVENDKILIQQSEGLFGSINNPKLAFICGLVAGDGTFANGSACIDLWDKTINLVDDLEFDVAKLIKDEQLNTTSTLTPKFKGDGRLRLVSKPLANVLETVGFTKETKLKIPNFIWDGDKNTISQYLKGLYITDGGFQTSKGTTVISLTSINKELLQDLQILWANFGVKTSIRKLHGEYECKPSWRILITSIQGCKIAESVLNLSDFRSGEVRDTFLSNIKKEGYVQKMYSTFTHLEQLENEPVYCLEVNSDNHSWTVNGLITHNSEIFLHSSEKYTFTCCLSSLNLLNWDRILENDGQAIFDSIVFLDCVNSEFIEKSKGIPGIEKSRAFAEWSRPVGLGVMGLSTYMQSKNIIFDSMEGHLLNTGIFKRIREKADEANKWLGETLGEPELMKGTGLRCSHVMALAPTLSTAVVMGGLSNGIEPMFANVFTQETSAGEVRRANPEIVKLLKSKGKWNKLIIQSIISNSGSVSHLEFLSDHEKAVFKTAFEVDQMAIIRMGNARGQRIDQGQSINLFFSSEAEEEYISSVHKEALRSEYIKGLYYIRSSSGVNARTSLTGECEMCSG